MLTAATDRLLRELQAMPVFRSQKDIVNVKAGMRKLRQSLPGPITVQRLCREDKSCINWPQYAELSYAPIIDNLLEKFNMYWPLRGEYFDEDVASFFMIEDCFEFSFETLAAINKRIKLADKSQVKAIVELATRYMKSDCLLVAIINISYIESDVKLDVKKSASIFSQWRQFTQYLMSLPQRVANRLKSNLPIDFMPQNYCRFLVFHLVRAIDFMSDSCFHVDTQYSLKFFSHLLSQVIIHFNDLCHSEALIEMINIFVSWTFVRKIEVSLYLRKRMIQNILENLSRPAIESFAVMVFRNVHIDYHLNSYMHFPICSILGKAIIFNKDWEYVLCTKLPVITHFPPESTLLLENLMLYISLCIDDPFQDNFLSNLTITLSSLWASQSALSHATLNEKFYRTQAFILALTYLNHLTKSSISKCVSTKIKENLFEGVPLHLESLDIEIRLIGMSTAEIALNILAWSEPNSVERPALKFDYSDFGERGKSLHEKFFSLSKKCALDINYVPKSEECNIPYANGFGILTNIGHKIFGDSPTPSTSSGVSSNKTLLNHNVASSSATMDVAGAIDLTSLEHRGIECLRIIDDIELDSDDDLEPYDMSQDLPAAVSKKPTFLRDLRDCLLEATDPEAFEESINVAEDLIYEQLPNDDFQFAIEILDVLLHLEKKFAVKDFEETRLSACIAIVCIHPAPCAEHICREFHSPMGRYSIVTRLLFLDILAESAGRLSHLPPDKQTKKDEKIKNKPQGRKPTVKVRDEPQTKDNALKRTERLVREKLEAKTKYFHSKSKHPFATSRKNTFAAVAKSFFYPLLYGFGRSQLNMSSHHFAKDPDHILLQRYLGVISMFLVASKNCSDAPKFCQDALELVWSLRYHSVEKIRIGAMSIVASSVLCIPFEILRVRCLSQLVEIRVWLADNAAIHLPGKVLTDSQAFARSTLSLLNNYLVDFEHEALL